MKFSSIIKPYTEDYKESLLDIFRMLIPHYFAQGELNDFSNYLELKADTYFVMLIGDKLVGGVGCEYKEEDDSGRITWIFLHPNYASKGLGRVAIEHCYLVLRSNPHVKKMVVRTSQKAFLFFEKLGYRTLFTETDYWGKGLDLYFMEANIDALKFKLEN